MKPLPTAIKELIQAGETERAFKVFLQKMPTDSSNRTYRKVAEQNLAHFKMVKNKDLQGRIAHDDAQIQYNQINYNFLQLLEHFKDGTTPSKDLIPTPERSKWKKQILFLVAAIVLLLAAGIGFFVKSNTTNISCPSFSTQSDLNVLLLPFQNLAEGNLKPEITIKERLEKLCKTHQLKSETNIFNKFYDQVNVQFPNFNDAQGIGKNCNANLVVWGTAEKTSNRIAMTAKFRLTDQESKFNLTKIQLEGETVVDSLQTISSIAKNGTITKDIEQLILTLFGVVAFENKNFAAAADALEKVSSKKDTSASLMTNMLLAESYLKLNDPTKALQSYDKALSIHPNYNLALNNRGTLLYQNGDYKKAEKDFTNIIQRNPKNAEALSSRATIFAKQNKKQEAIKDIKAAKKINPNIRVIDLEALSAVNFSSTNTIRNPLFRIRTGNPADSKYFSNEKYAVSFYPNVANSKVQVAKDLEFGSHIIMGLHFAKGQKKIKIPIQFDPIMKDGAKYFIRYKRSDESLKNHLRTSILNRNNQLVRRPTKGSRLGNYKGAHFMIFERVDNINRKEYLEAKLTCYVNPK